MEHGLDEVRGEVEAARGGHVARCELVAGVGVDAPPSGVVEAGAVGGETAGMGEEVGQRRRLGLDHGVERGGALLDGDEAGDGGEELRDRGQREPTVRVAGRRNLPVGSDVGGGDIGARPVVDEVESAHRPTLYRGVAVTVLGSGDE